MSTLVASSRFAAAVRPPEPRVGAPRVARFLLWLAVIVPFVYTTAQTASNISAGSGLGGLAIVRGGGPAALWGLSILAAPVVRRGVGVAELALGAYCVVIVMSVLIVGNPSPHATLLKAISTVFVFISLGRLVRMYPTPRDAVLALVGFVHVVLLVGLVEVVAFRSTVYQVGAGSLDGTARLNLVVPSVSANPLAMIGVAGILSCVVGVGPRWLRFNGLVRNVLMVAYGYEIYLTGTRSALGVGLLMIVVSVLLRARRRPLSTLFVVVAALAATVTLLPDVLPHLHTFLQRGQNAQGLHTLSGRTDIWHQAYLVWQRNQTFGLGYYSGHRLGIPGLNQTQSNIDNTWLETLVDVGIVGTVPLALFALAGMVRLLRRSALRGDIRLWAVGVAVYGIVISFINPTIQQPGAGQVLLGLLLLVLVPVIGGAATSEPAGQDAATTSS